MSFILDTNIISELRKEVPAPELIAWFERVSEDSLYLSVLTLGEIQNGISNLPDGKKKNDIIIWFESLKKSFSGRIHTINEEIALKWGELTAICKTAGRPLHAVDGLIASTAAVTGSILVTRNTDDFESTGIMVMNPWDDV